MLIFNIDVSDLLNNGALGTVIGIEESNKGKVCSVIVKFDNPEAGKESRKRNPVMASKYPNGTVIVKQEREYSLSKTQGLVSSTAKLIQIPLVLAWAVTVHKFQGQTVKHPQRVVIDLRSVFEAAQAYVMASRVQELDQLFILEELAHEKIYPSHIALDEIKRLLSVSINKNPTPWQENNDKRKISFLNCRSIKNKFENIKADKCLLQGQIIILTETWLDNELASGDYQLAGYQASFSNRGRGKGIATYYTKHFEHKESTNCSGFSLVKFEASDIVIIGVYRSNEGDCRDISEKMCDMVVEDKLCVIGGDMNINLLKSPNNHITVKLKQNGFEQIIKKATHIEGGLIDHVYIRQGKENKSLWDLEHFPKYYSDHDGLGLTLWQV